MRSRATKTSCPSRAGRCGCARRRSTVWWFKASTTCWYVSRDAAHRCPTTASSASAQAPSEARMRAVVQRVARASVTVDGVEVSSIGPGLLVLLGVGSDDEQPDAAWLADKVAQLRIFPDNSSVMNRSIEESNGA